MYSYLSYWSIAYVICYICPFTSYFTCAFEQRVFLDADEPPRNDKRSFSTALLARTCQSAWGAALCDVTSKTTYSKPQIKTKEMMSVKMYFNVAEHWSTRGRHTASPQGLLPRPQIYLRFFWNTFTNKIPHILPLPCLFAFFIYSVLIFKWNK